MIALISFPLSPDRPVTAVIVTPAEMSVPQLVMNCFAPLMTHLPSRDSARVLVAPATTSRAKSRHVSRIAFCSVVSSKSIAPILACDARRPLLTRHADRRRPRRPRWTQRQPPLPYADLFARASRRAVAGASPRLHQLSAADGCAGQAVLRTGLERAHPALSPPWLHQPPQHIDLRAPRRAPHRPGQPGGRRRLGDG